MAFTPEQIAEIESIVRSVIDTDGVAVNDTEAVPTVEADDIDDTYSFPLVKYSDTTPRVPTGYQQVNMAGLISRVTGEVETEGFLEPITEQEFNAIFGDGGSSDDSSSE